MYFYIYMYILRSSTKWGRAHFFASVWTHVVEIAHWQNKWRRAPVLYNTLFSVLYLHLPFYSIQIQFDFRFFQSCFFKFWNLDCQSIRFCAPAQRAHDNN